MPRKEIFCENCDSYQALEEYEPQTDERNPYTEQLLTGCSAISRQACRLP